MGLGQGGADLAHLAARAGGHDLGQTLTTHHMAGGKHGRGIVASRCNGFGRPFGGGAFAYGYGFAGQQRFVHLQVLRLQQPAVGGDAVALGQQQQVAGHHFAGRDALNLTVTQHACLRLGQAAQRLQGRIGAAFLPESHAQHRQHEQRQGQAFDDVAQHHVKQCGSHQQHEHRFARHVQQAAHQGAWVFGVRCIGPEAGQTLAGLGGAQAGRIGRCAGGRHGASISRKR